MIHNEIIYRNVTVEDAEAINEYMNKIGKETDFLNYKEYMYTTEQKKTHIEYYHKHDNCLYILAEYNGQIVGTFAFLQGWKDGQYHSGEMGIDVMKEYWGYGIGTELMRRFKRWVIDKGDIKRVELWVNADNFRAINLYIKFGFFIEGRHKNKLFVDDRYADMFSMALLLE